MLGAIVGVVCVIGAVKIARRVFGYRRAYWGYGGCSGYGGRGRGYGRGPGGGGMLGWLFDRLRTTPEQERVIEEAFTRLRSEHASVREELGQTREDVARAVENGVVDESSLEETFARHDRLLARLRVDWVNALKTVSEALDPSQRREMAGLVGRRGFFGGRWGFGRAGVWA